MAEHLYVDPDALAALVPEASAAVTSLEAARGLLDDASHAMNRAAGFDQGSGADDKVATFARQFREELRLIGDMIEAGAAALGDAAACYVELEAGLVGVLSATVDGDGGN